jgi:GH15 family glucan-1,4-alpha-glucosidase
MYTLHGDHRAPEREVRGLEGFQASRPVRVGNSAVDQLQLDNWGHLVDAAYTHAHHGGRVDAEAWRSLRAFVQFAADNWRRRDQGIWEVRGGPRHFVHSKVMCWVALDRGIRFVRELGRQGPAERWEVERDRIRETVMSDGVDPAQGNFKRAFDDPALDASLLLIPIAGFLPGDDPHVLRTIERIREELASDDLVHRYRCDDGLPGREGPFVACSFWLAHALALAGRHHDACDVFERTCRRANDVGLLPEEIDPDSGAFLGNFPQGLSHIALLNAALAIARAGDAR